jgi:hypothetical protein
VDVAREEEVTGRIVIELTPIVTLNALDGATELSRDPGKEVRQGGKSV